MHMMRRTKYSDNKEMVLFQILFISHETSTQNCDKIGKSPDISQMQPSGALILFPSAVPALQQPPTVSNLNLRIVCIQNK